MTTIEVTKFPGAFGAYFGFSMLPAAVAFVRRKTARWFLFTGGLFLLARWTLNCFNLMPLFSWRGYEPDWPVITAAIWVIIMLPAIFGNVVRPRVLGRAGGRFGKAKWRRRDEQGFP